MRFAKPCPPIRRRAGSHRPTETMTKRPAGRNRPYSTPVHGKVRQLHDVGFFLDENRRGIMKGVCCT